jgi:polyhydroxybutyrate depolymerase
LKKIFITFFFLLFFSCSNQEDDLDIIVDNPSWTQKEFTTNYGGLNRKYILYKPKSYSENAPLVFVLHGFGSNNKTILNYSQMNSIADQNGFMVCYPLGSTEPITGQTHWNANLQTSVNDIGFLSFLALKIQEEYKTSFDNVFTAGMSNGGFMSYTLGCEKSDIFKAVASITGTMSGYDWNNCSPAYKIPVLQMSGTSDTVVPWDGTMNVPEWPAWAGAPHILEVMEFWSDLNACTQDEIIDFPDIDKSDYSTVSLTKKKGGSYNNEVWFYKVEGGGHDWPGAWGNQDINASEEIWKFFKKHIN